MAVGATKLAQTWLRQAPEAVRAGKIVKKFTGILLRRMTADDFIIPSTKNSLCSTQFGTLTLI